MRPTPQTGSVSAVILAVIFCGMVSGCARSFDGPFWGEWLRPYTPAGTSGSDTIYLRFTESDDFQLSLETHQSGASDTSTPLGGGTYYYSDTAIYFDFTTGGSGTPSCPGTTSIYGYRLSGQLTLTADIDTCGASTSASRASLLSGTWLRQ